MGAGLRRLWSRGMRTIRTSANSSQPPKRQSDFPDGREFRSTGSHVRNPGACGSRRTADVTHSRCVGHGLSFHSWMSARRIGGERLLTSPSGHNRRNMLKIVAMNRRQLLAGLTTVVPLLGQAETQSDDQVSLKFGNGADDDDDGSTQRATGVDVFAEADVFDVEPVEFVQHIEEVFDRPGDPV